MALFGSLDFAVIYTSLVISAPNMNTINVVRITLITAVLFMLGVMVAYSVQMNTLLWDRQYDIGVKGQG